MTRVLRSRSGFLATLIAASVLAACLGARRALEPPIDGRHLDRLPTARIRIEETAFEVWVARTTAERSLGLMGVTEEHVAPLPDGTERGMLFVYSRDVQPRYWMRNTILPLDLAFVRSDQTIAEVHRLIPHDETRVVPKTPVRFVLEVRAGLFAARGIGVGDRLALPPDIAR